MESVVILFRLTADCAELIVIDELDLGAVHTRPAGRTMRVAPELQLAKARLERIEDEQPTGQRVRLLQDDLDGLVDLDRADDPAQHAQNACFLAGRRHLGRRRIGIQAPIARPFERDKVVNGLTQNLEALDREIEDEKRLNELDSSRVREREEKREALKTGLDWMKKISNGSCE